MQCLLKKACEVSALKECNLIIYISVQVPLSEVGREGKLFKMLSVNVNLIEQ